LIQIEDETDKKFSNLDYKKTRSVTFRGKLVSMRKRIMKRAGIIKTVDLLLFAATLIVFFAVTAYNLY